MKTIALRLYGKNDMRLEKFDLPPLSDHEILADIRTNSICMSSHKAVIQGADHKRVPDNVAQNPIMLGHEFAGTILEVGSKVDPKYRAGDKYSIQPALSIPGRELEAPGYSFPYIGGQATKIIIPAEVLERNCLLPYMGEGFFKASLAEPVSCIIGAFNTSYHFKQGEYIHRMGIAEGGSCIILAGAGPMGLGAIDYAIHGPRKPGLLVITDIDHARLERAKAIFSPAEASRNGINLEYINTRSEDPISDLIKKTGGKGYDDVFVFAPIRPLIEQASRILAFGGCLNFFAGPPDRNFSASINFYEIHYSGQHVVGSSGGNTDDMRAALDLMSSNILNPAVMITHIGGLNSSARTISDLPQIPGGKKLIYTGIDLPLTALEDFELLGREDPLFRRLSEITERHLGLWSTEAEEYLLANARPIEIE